MSKDTYTVGKLKALLEKYPDHLPILNTAGEYDDTCYVPAEEPYATDVVFIEERGLFNADIAQDLYPDEGEQPQLCLVI